MDESGVEAKDIELVVQQVGPRFYCFDGGRDTHTRFSFWPGRGWMQLVVQQVGTGSSISLGGSQAVMQVDCWGCRNRPTDGLGKDEGIEVHSQGWRASDGDVKELLRPRRQRMWGEDRAAGLWGSRCCLSLVTLTLLFPNPTLRRPTCHEQRQLRP